MTQTNNERVDITPLQQVNAVQSIREAKTLDDALRVMNGLAANGWLKLWDSATHPDGTSWRDKSPISQNEQAKQIPDGWKLVPIDITEDMHVAAVKAIQKCTGNDDFPRTVYKAMLNAAPTTSLTSETNTEVGK